MGSADQFLSSDVSWLAPHETVVEAMLQGWVVQQRSRMLAGHTVDQRVCVVRRFLMYTNEYPWQWGPADVEEWTAELVGRGLAHATVRNYQQAVALFCAYVVDPRYRWIDVCEKHFGAHPVQVFHEWNTVEHRGEYEGRPGNRPLTRDELQAFFDYCDARVGAVHANGRKGWLAAYRDAVLFKVTYAWGLRRREATMLETVDWSGNAAADEFGRYGALAVRYGKAMRGGPPRRRTVLSTMRWATEAVAEWIEEIPSELRRSGQRDVADRTPGADLGRRDVPALRDLPRSYRSGPGSRATLSASLLRQPPARGRV